LHDEPATIEQALALLKERPNDAELYQQLGGLYFQRGDLNEAWQAFTTSFHLNPDDPWTALRFGTLLTICDDKKFARTLFDHALNLAPNLSTAWWVSANLHRKVGDHDWAEQEYKRAVEVDPNDEQAKQKLAEWREFIAAVRAEEEQESEE
jgi:cytochrome c-type biogenesis protein CcmH/NrfG